SLVSVEDGSDLAANQLTMEAMPNPLTRNSIVKCTLAGDQPRNVNVDIFDMQGSKIANVFNGSMIQGENILKLNDIPQVSGSYIIVAEINGNITVLPVVFVK
ncbi:MAG: T9SS type A sorting domain-containing protein, partial [Chlorobi bacterium]|nr:T9SS type A sorting domain-containing protein [Chlorobiota bacterium]